ncbi:class I SAM-dependent methyltransferase [Microbacterium sp. MAHUQ-60]|uniref:class I SAM-dependent methyltransferase n=1 Tax=unclassified Microbacterium TaxID=2609290 RepID=UPI003606055A
MPEFDFSRLRRFPDVEASNLQAWDATDELLVRWALDAGIPGEEIAVIGDEYGAIALALADAGLRGIRVHQDLVTGRQALARNAAALGVTLDAPEQALTPRRVDARHADAGAQAPDDATPAAAVTAHEFGQDLLLGARLVLLQLPKALAELEEIADAVARWAAPDATLIAGGRVKHMTLAQNDVLARSFAAVQAQRAERKSRLIVASDPLPVAETAPFPISETHDGLTLVAHGGVFAGARLDIGTRALLDAMATLSLPVVHPHVIDLGCGTGALAAAFARQHPDAVIVATDRSASAVRSARATMAANGLDGRVHVTLDDAGSELPDASADLILLNPPFHLGAGVHESAGRRLIRAAARLLKPGGEVWTVFNSHLDHRRVLSREVGSTEQVARTPKFTVTRSVRRG